MKDENPFADAISRLRERPLSPLFLFKSRVLGSVLDARSLLRTGWANVFPPGSETRLWKQCLWWEREFRSEGGRVLVQASTTGIIRPKEENPADYRFARITPGLYGELDEPDGESLVILRKVRFFETVRGGLAREERPAFGDGEVLDSARAAILECEVRGWPTLAEDWGYQAMGLQVELPPNVTPTEFERRAGVMDDLLRRAENDACSENVERYLVRFVHAVSDASQSPESQRDLTVFSNGRALWKFVHAWFCAAPRDGAATRLLAWALEKSDSLEEPFTAIGWVGLAGCLGCLGFFREGVLAADRAVACDDATERNAEFLWQFVLTCVNESFGSCADGTPEPDVAWLVELLFRRETLFENRDGYWTLLGLLLAANGNGTKTALATIARGVPLDEPPSDTARPLPIAHPREWQAVAAVQKLAEKSRRHALAVFPATPARRPEDPFGLPRKTILGVADGDFLTAFFEPDPADGTFRARADAASGSVSASGGQWILLDPEELGLSRDGVTAAAHARLRCDADAAVGLVGVATTSNSTRPTDDVACTHVYPLPHSGTWNVRAAPWALLPYLDNACGEICFRLENGTVLAAADPLFCRDRKRLRRGMPLPASVYAIPWQLRRAEPLGPVSLPDGTSVDDTDARILFEHKDENTRALYAFRGRVEAVDRIRVTAGGEVLRLLIDVGRERLPCSLPLYVRENLFEGGDIRIGDVLDGMAFLQIAFGFPDEESEAWLAGHPNGPGVFRAQTGCGLQGSIAYFCKRPPDGARGIPLPGGNPGETYEPGVEWPTPETVDAANLAFSRLRASVGEGACARWDPNPAGIDLSARIGGTLHRYHVLKAIGDETPDSRLPSGLEPLFVRIVDGDGGYRVEYEGFPG